MIVKQPDPEHFLFKYVEIAGEQCTLVIPNHIGCKWTKDNLIFRSSIWTKDWQPVSLGYKKFFNHGESPALYPSPEDYSDWNAMEKLDGSCLIVSWYKGQRIVRTRGTSDAQFLDNGDELDWLMDTYPKVFEKDLDTSPYSFLYEWTTPSNRIVLNYGDQPRLFLTNVVRHNDYSYMDQDSLDVMAKELGVERPKRHKFKTLAELVLTVTAWEKLEGICLYYKKDQWIAKFKSDWYRAHHRIATEMKSMENVLDVYLNMPEELQNFTSFFEHIATQIDFETATDCRGFISQIVDAHKQVRSLLAHMEDFVNNLRGRPRKDQALAITKAYGETNRASYAFAMLDGKPMVKDHYKKLFLQILK